MRNPLLVRQRLADLAGESKVIDFECEIKDFAGLQSVLAADLSALPADRRPRGWQDRAVRGTLSFAPLTQGHADGDIPGDTRVAVEGRVATTVSLVCQRCLDPFDLPVESMPDLVLVPPDGGPGTGGAEAWELDDDWFVPADLVEELLVMGLPFAAKHADAACGAPADTDAAVAVGDMTRPFADLRAQMEQRNTDRQQAGGERNGSSKES